MNHKYHERRQTKIVDDAQGEHGLPANVIEIVTAKMSIKE